MMFSDFERWGACRGCLAAGGVTCFGFLPRFCFFPAFLAWRLRCWLLKLLNVFGFMSRPKRSLMNATPLVGFSMPSDRARRTASALPIDPVPDGEAGVPFADAG